MIALRPFLLGLLLAAPLHAYDSRITYTTPEELQGFGDFDGDTRLDVVTVDRPTGQFRLGLSQADGSLLWQATRSSGCPAASDLAVGTVRNSTSLDLVLTGPSANQVFLLDPSAAFTRPQLLTPSGLGPTTVAAVDLNLAGNDPTLHDLVVFSAWNSPPTADRRHLFQSLPGSLLPAGDVNTGTPVRHASRVLLKTGDPEHFSTFLTTTFRIINSQNASLPIKTSLAGLPADADFVHAPFLGLANFQFLFFEPGTAGLLYSNSNLTTGVLSAAVNRNVGPDPVRSVHVIHDGTRYGFAVIYNDGDYANLYHLDASGVPVLDDTLSPPAGQLLKGILGTSPGNLHLLHGPAGSSSTGSIHHTNSGSGWTPSSSATLPGIGAATAIANVFLYDKEPLVNPDAKLIETIQVPDWTSTLLIDGGGNVSVSAETFGGTGSGLGSATTAALGAKPTGATFGLANQPLGAFSLTTDQGSLGLIPIQISIDPPAGTYPRYFTPVLTAPDTGAINAYYRFDTTSTWNTFTFGVDSIIPPGNTLTPFTVYYYAEDSGSGQRSPIYRADYAFAGEPGTLDSDGDGVPDHVELDLGLDPLAGDDTDLDTLSDRDEILLGSDPANGSETATYGTNVLALPPSRTNDGDGDGYSDFAEWAGGSDPFDAGSTPASPALTELQNVFDLNIRPRSHSGITGQQPNRNSYPVGDPVYSPTDLRLHNPDGDLIQFTQTKNHGGVPLPDPFGIFTGVPATGRDLFVTFSTPPTFDMVQDAGLPGWGRELIGLVPIPTLEIPPVPYTYGGGSPATEAANWIAAAQSHFASLTRTSLDRTPNLYDALALLLFERITGDLLRARGTITSPLPVSLTAFRDTIPPDGTTQSQSLTPAQLLSLQSYLSPADSGHLLQELFGFLRNEARTGTGTQIAALRKLANEIYRISASLTDTDPGPGPGPNAGLYPSPYETLRSVVRTLPDDIGDIDGLIPLPGDPGVDPATSYAAAHTLSSTELQNADGALVSFLAQLTPRSTQTFTALVNATSFSSTIPLLEETPGGAFLRLYDADGDPYTFPQTLDLPVGTELEILAFTDRTNLPAGTGTALEVISATILAFPAPPHTDSNLNAIDDAYELYFFGADTDPFGDLDGDGYNNLQESLEGTHPGNAASFPAAPALPPGLPPVTITRSGGNVTFDLEFPSLYGDQLYFLLQSPGSDLALPFVESTDAATDAGSNLYTLTIPAPPTEQYFRFRLALRP